GSSNSRVEVLHHPHIGCALADNADERETLGSFKRLTRCIWRKPCNDGRCTTSQRNAAQGTISPLDKQGTPVPRPPPNLIAVCRAWQGSLRTVDQRHEPWAAVTSAVPADHNPVTIRREDGIEHEPHGILRHKALLRSRCRIEENEVSVPRGVIRD